MTIVPLVLIFSSTLLATCAGAFFVHASCFFIVLPLQPAAFYLCGCCSFFYMLLLSLRMLNH
jgi:hypothetical protein